MKLSPINLAIAVWCVGGVGVILKPLPETFTQFVLEILWILSMGYALIRVVR